MTAFGGLNKKIMRLAIPNIVSNISVPLLGLVDTALMGRQEHAAQYLSAIALAGAIFSFVYWGFGFLRMGTTGMTAHALGAGNEKLAANTLGRALVVAIGAAALVLILQVPISWIGFQLVEGSEASTAIAREYFFIRIWAAPATIGLYALHGWFLGMQNAVIPMILAIFVNVVNILMNLVFVLGLGMDADGIALATVIAQYAGFLLAMGILLYHYRDFLKKMERKLLFQWGELKEFFAVNLDIFIRTLCLIFSLSYFIARSGDLGDEMLAVNNLLYQLMILTSYVVDGFAFAAESLVGKLSGQRAGEELKRLVRKIFLWGFVVGGLFAGVYLVAGEPILRLLTDKSYLIDEAWPYIPWLSLLALTGSWAYLWDGIYLGAVKSKPMRNSMLISTFVVFLPATIFLQKWLNNDGLWMAMVLFMISRGLILQILARKKIFF